MEWLVVCGAILFFTMVVYLMEKRDGGQQAQVPGPDDLSGCLNEIGCLGILVSLIVAVIAVLIFST